MSTYTRLQTRSVKSINALVPFWGACQLSRSHECDHLSTTPEPLVRIGTALLHRAADAANGGRLGAKDEKENMMQRDRQGGLCLQGGLPTCMPAGTGTGKRVQRLNMSTERFLHVCVMQARVLSEQKITQLFQLQRQPRYTMQIWGTSMS